MKWFQTYVSPDFRCVLKTDLSVEEVQARLKENVSKDFHWPWKPQPLLGGDIKEDKFRVWDRKEDPGLVLHGAIEFDGTGARILIRTRYSFFRALMPFPVGIGLALLVWYKFGQIHPTYTAAGIGAIGCIAILLYFDGLSSYWSEVETTLEALAFLLEAEVEDRSHH